NYIIPLPADFPGQLFIRRAIVKKLEAEELPIPKEIIHLVPFLGPLHVSLNTRESIIIAFHSFFDQLYKTVFKKKQKLAAKPRPWRINLLLYLAHEGWLLIKRYIVKLFEESKDIAYVTFFDLLDNLIPAVLDVYTHLFRENHFEEYVSTIFRLWTVMRRFQRHNYDKIMLAFLSDIQYWKTIDHSIINVLKTHLNAFDEYPVENFHSLLRRHTSAK
ncbi:36822_t:CDS:1, partial [Racocetra persica]